MSNTTSNAKPEETIARLTAERDAALAENATLRKATKEYFDAREAFDASGSEESERRLEYAHEALRNLA